MKQFEQDSKSSLSYRLIWAARMAYRDCRRSSYNLFLMFSAIAIGVAALVALGSLEDNVSRVIDEQAKPLLGADLLISSRTAFSKEAEEFLSSIAPVSSRQLSFASMVYFPKSEGTRLIQVFALSGDFPYYGAFSTEPKSAAGTYRAGNRALVDRSLMLQFGAQPGDKVRIGEHDFIIEGALTKVPGVVEVRSSVAPRVYIRLSDLNKTKLIQKGSRVRYGVYYRLKDEFDLEDWLSSQRETLVGLNLRADTVESRKKTFSKGVRTVSVFLELIGFLSMILGGLGVGSAISVYLRRKRSSVAVLRCLGASGLETAAIFLFQVVFFGLLGIFAGALAGLFLQQYLAAAVSQFLPLSVETSVSWSAVGSGAALGLLMLLLFSSIPLLSVLEISPLASLRIDYSTEKEQNRLRYLGLICIVLGVCAFAVLHTKKLYVGSIYAITVLLSIYILGLLGYLLRYLVKFFLPPKTPFALRQGLANLYRPKNQTQLLMRSIGTGVFLICLVLVSQQSIISKVVSLEEEGRPNTILFDVQTDQRSGIEHLIKEHNMPVLDDVPIVSMRIHSIKGVTVKDLLLRKGKNKIPGWTLGREYRSTYRDALVDSEKTLSGTFVPEVFGSGDGVREIVPISMEAGITERLKVSLGDSIVFNVQGILLKTRLVHIRAVDWQRVQPNFFVVFPKGVLEKAPQFHVFVTRVDSQEQAAEFQRSIVKKFPTVSLIDLTLVLNTLNEIIRQLTVVVRFVGAFCIAAAMVVLITAVIGGRDQRIRENALLKALGAQKRVVLTTITAEFLLLGACAAVSGALLALCAGYVMSAFVFESPFSPVFLPVAAAAVISVLSVTAIGVIASEGTYRKPALLVLRSDTE